VYVIESAYDLEWYVQERRNFCIGYSVAIKNQDGSLSIVEIVGFNRLNDPIWCAVE
jgi:hypothetical protein